MITIQDVAMRAGVSKMTVSRVLNGLSSVKEETRLRVEKAMHELNYMPNSVARSLSSGKTRTIGLLCANLTSPFFLNLAHGAETVAHELGYRLILANHDDDHKREQEYVEALISARVDGMLITPASDKSEPTLSLLRDNGVAFVLIDRVLDSIKADYVIGDSYTAAYELVSHLIDQGHHRIAIITGPLNVYTARERLRGYQTALKDRGIDVPASFVRTVSYSQNDPKESHFEAVSHTLRGFLQGVEPPTAIFAVNHAIAVHLLQAQKKLGHPSNSIAVTCFEEIDPWNLFESHVNAAVQPGFDFGKEGMRLLLERLKYPDSPYKGMVFKPKLTFEK